MQSTSAQHQYRHHRTSPHLSDSEWDHQQHRHGQTLPDNRDTLSISSSSSSSSSTAPSPSSSTSTSAATVVGHAQTPRAQRPKLTHNHTPSGSFVRIKRKNTHNHNNHNNTSSNIHTPVNAAAQSVATSPSAEHPGAASSAKVCFICYGDSSEDVPPSNTTGRRNSLPPTTTRKWVHPCKCSLMAHEDCLLHWVAVSKPSGSSNTISNPNKRDPVSCPQCNTPYTMNQLDIPLLNFIESIEGIWAKNVSKLLVVGIGVGSWTLLGLYGMWTIRQLAGAQVAEQLFSRRSTRWLTAPLVLPVIVLSRTHLLDSVLPFLPLTLILNSTLPNTPRYYAVQHFPLSDLQISFPPNPALTLCILPWVRAAYVALRRRILRTVLRKPPTPLASPGTPGLDANGNARQPIPGMAGGAQLPGEADFFDNQNRQAGQGGAAQAGNANGDVAMAVNDLGAMLEDRHDGRRVVITVSSGARLLAGSLLFPWAAAAAGSVLLWLAKRQTTSSGGASGRGWLARLLGVGLAVSAGATANAAESGLNGFLAMSTRFIQPFSSNSKEYIDPVWWRNAIGGALLVLTKDFWSLTRQVMERKRAQSRRIENKPFMNGDTMPE